MPRIPTLELETAIPSERTILEELTTRYGRASNMKRTLAHSRPALDALMTWYPLWDTIVPYLGVRLARIYAHAISAQSDCLICGTYFRRELIDAGEQPDALVLDEREQTVVDFGCQITVDSNNVNDALYGRMTTYFNDQQIVELTAFAGLMIATNIVNNVLRVDLDGYLEGYRLPAITKEVDRG